MLPEKMANNSGSICQRKSTHFLKVPLKSTEQIYLIFLIPTLINCILYIINFSGDLVVATQHFRENNPIWGCCTIGLMYAPAITYFMITVSRPDWWMSEDDKLTKGVFGWFCLQVCQLVGFVFFALYRYAGTIVLSVDAIMLNGEERTKTLNIAAAPAAIELYFFLQAWFQAAPQAIFQTHLLFRETEIHRSSQSVAVHVLSIIMSIVILAIQTTSFQRFESQRVNGRKLPWAMWLKKYCVQELCDLEEKTPLKSFGAKEDENVRADSREALEAPQEQGEITTQSDVRVTLDRQISITPPLPPKNVHVTPPPTPLRGITTVAPLPIPDVPAPPRPDSICNAMEQPEQSVVESTRILTENEENLRIPKRRYSKKGLEEDDPIGKFLSFLWWFFFILARILVIAMVYEFYPIYLLSVLGVHYALMLLYLFYYAKYYDIMIFFVNLWLGLVYTLSLIEYRIKFKSADKWLSLYYVLVMLQNTSLILVWYFYANWDGFWYNYVFYAIFLSMGLCLLSTVFYFALLKPKKNRVYSS